MEATCSSTYESPLGTLTLIAGDGVLRQMMFPEEGAEPEPRDPRAQELAAAHAQLDQYFAGERQRFELPLVLLGSSFERQVWEQLRQIPFGTTVSYGELAGRLGLEHPEAAREVGAAVARTPLPVIVPCHRVVGADGALTGYRGGLERKRALLALEASQLALL